MPYAHFADAVVVVHVAFVVFVAVGGFLAWRYPLVLRAHVLAIGWAVGIVTVGWACPLTELEKFFRARAGIEPYAGGFVDRYLTGVLYPPDYERFIQSLLAVGVVVSYVGLRRRRQSSSRWLITTSVRFENPQTALDDPAIELPRRSPIRSSSKRATGIQTIRAVTSPEKLGHLGPVADAWAVAREVKQARRPKD